MTSESVVYGNATSFTVARVARKGLTFIYLVIVARYAGLRVAGLFFLTVAYGTLFFTCSDFGLTNVFIRDAARRPEDCERSFSETLSVKLLISGILLTLIIFAVNYLEYPSITKRLVYIVVGSQLLSSLSFSFFGCFRAVQRMHYEAIGMVVGGLLTLAAGALAVYFRLSIYYLIVAVALDGLFNFAFSAFLVIRRLNIIPRFYLTRRSLTDLLPIALPFALSGIFLRIYALDTVLVSRFMAQSDVALYGAASWMVGSMKFMPIGLAAALFPAFSVTHQSDRDGMVRTLQNSERLMLWLVVPISAGGVLLAEPIIETVFGYDYGQSVVSFQILCVALIPVFLSTPLISLLNAIGGQKASAANLSLAIGVHLMSSVFLIPILGIEGAALSLVISNLTLLCLCQFSAKQLGVLDWVEWARWLRPIGIGTVAMIATVWVARDAVYLPIVITLGAVAYVGGAATSHHNGSPLPSMAKALIAAFRLNR